MRVVAAVAVLWIVGAFVTCVFVAGATRRQEPKPDEDLEKDVDAAADLALEDVYGLEDLPPSVRHDRSYSGILERRVVRASGRRGLTPPRPAGLR